MPAKVSISIAPRWPAGSAHRPLCSRRWSRPFATMCSPPPGFMPTTHPCRYSRQATAGPRQEGSGPMYGMAVPALMRPARGLVRLFTRPPRRTSARTSYELPRNAPGRCLCGLSSALRGRKDRRSRMLDAYPAQVPRYLCSHRITHRVRGHPPHRRTLCRRKAGARQSARDPARRQAKLAPSRSSKS